MQDPVLTPIFTAALISAGLPATFSVGAATFSIPTILGTATLIAGSVAIAYAMAPKAHSEAGHSALRQALPPVFEGTGECRLAGAYALFEQSGDLSIDVLAFHDGRIGGILGYYLFDDPVTLDGSDNVITPNPPKDNRYDEQHVKILSRLGAATETAYAEITARLPAIWTSSHRGDETASIAVLATAGAQKNHMKFFPLGRPEASVRANLAPIWDGRDGTQDPDDNATWDAYPAWDDATTYALGERVTETGAVYYSRQAGNLDNPPRTSPTWWCRVDTNPVLGLIYYLVHARNGLHLERERLVTSAQDLLMLEADKCDALVLKKNGDYEPRYTCSTWWNGETDPAEVIADYLASCDGWINLDGDGALSLVVGSYSTPTCLPITDDYIVGLDLAYESEDQERADILTLAFTSPAHKFKTVPGETWPTGGSIGRALPFGPKGVQSHAQLRRLAKRQYARANTSLRGTITTHMGGLQWQGRRWVPIQSALAGELNDAVIEVRRMTRNFAARQCVFEFVVIDVPTIDLFDPATEEGEAPPEAADNVIGGLPVPENVLASADGTPPFHIDISWDDPGRSDLGWRIRYRLSDQGDGSPGPWTDVDISTPTDLGTRLAATVFPTTGDQYDIQVASIGARGTVSDFAPEPPLVVTTDELAIEDNVGNVIADNSTPAKYIKENV